MGKTQTMGILLAGGYGEKTILRRPSELSRNKNEKKVIIYQTKPLSTIESKLWFNAREYQWGWSFPSDVAYESLNSWSLCVSIVDCTATLLKVRRKEEYLRKNVENCIKWLIFLTYKIVVLSRLKFGIDTCAIFLKNHRVIFKVEGVVT